MRANRTSRLAVHRYPASQVGRRAGSRGFTLIELMTTITIVGILAMVAVPSFNEAALSSKLNTLANNFVASAQLARSEAIKRNSPVTLCASANGTSCGGNWRDGWVVLAGGTAVYSQAPFPNDFLLTGNVTSINFQPTGVGATCARLVLNNSKYVSQERILTISATGRPKSEKSSTFACP